MSEDHGIELPDHRPCDQALHRLAGEAAASRAPVNLGRARVGLRLAIVPGLAAQCFGERALPLRYAASHVEQLGYEVTWIDVDGLSSSTRNAAKIRAAILEMDEIPDRPIVLLGYSKGASDVLEASADPTVAARASRRWSALAVPSMDRRWPTTRQKCGSMRSPICRGSAAKGAIAARWKACAAARGWLDSLRSSRRRRSATTRW